MSLSGRAVQLIFCLLILKLHSQVTLSQLCSKAESYALLQLKDGFEYDESASLDCKPPHPKMVSWKAGTDCCSWDGVTCQGVTGHVIALDLSCSGIRGNVNSNSSLFHLSHLRRLNLAFNDFNRSSVPPEFGTFPGLTHLNLSNTWFSGQVPSEISHLSKLISLDLSLNEPLMLEAPAMKMIVQNLTLVKEIFLDYINISSVDLGSLMNLSSSLTSLSLRLCGLQGQFPENIFRLPNLQLLNLGLNSDLHGHLPVSNWSSALELLMLSSTSFSGELPDSIGKVNSLQLLDLGNCAFNGSIPASLGNLEQLTELDLSNNNWTGQIPDVFSNLSKLNSLSLQSGNFSGMLPSSVFNLTKLLHLDLSQNQLEGTLPDQICGLRNVSYLELSYNLLSGTIPSCLFSLPSLNWFHLNNNQLTGELGGEHWSKSLQEIRLESNKIHGLIPPSISELVNLTDFDVSSNNLSGIVELDRFSNMKNLWGLDLSHNSLSVVINNNRNSTWPLFYKLALSSCNIVEFPDFLKTQNQLNFLSLSHNRIRGEIPKWLSVKGMQSLQYLDLSHNFLTIVNELPLSLQYLDLTSNLLQQPFPILPQSMYILLIANNKLKGEIPSWICNITTFQIINLSNNRLSGNIPQCLGNFSAELSVLNLRMNNFHGTIPVTFTEGNKIRSLDLNGNELEGALPRSLANCKMLEVLDLGNNYINDSFPHWLQTLPKLQVLVLRSNRLHGSIGNPTVESPFSSLRIIDLSHNEFIGLLPTKYIANFQAMKKMDEVKATPKYIGEIYYQDSTILTMKGTEQKMERILIIFTAIDLSSNQFEGQIPQEVGSLSSLLVLNFSRNSLTGQLPSSLGNLVALESLDLSSNRLSGGIPEQLTRLTFLAVLNLSYNQLAGPIPHGSQFDTFQNDSYVGNLRLCGFPLSVKCSNDMAPQPPTFQEKEDSASLFNWKFAIIGYGCGLGIGWSMGYIVFSTGKPQWFVGMVEVQQKKWLRRQMKKNI